MPGLSTTGIIHFSKTDHPAVMVEVLENDFPKGPRRWPFNASYLKDNDFVKHKGNFVSSYFFRRGGGRGAELEDTDSRTKWGLLKAGIKLECIHFSKSNRFEIEANEDSDLDKQSEGSGTETLSILKSNNL